MLHLSITSSLGTKENIENISNEMAIKRERNEIREPKIQQQK